MATLPFVLVTGKRSDGTLFICDGYVYKKSTVAKTGNIYVKCAYPGVCCLATGVIRSGHSEMTVKSQHNHSRDKAEEELALYRHSLRSQAMDLSTAGLGFRNICDRESFRYPEGSLLRGFPSDEQMMRRARKKSLPPVPQDLDALHDLLNFQPQWRDLALGLNTPKEFFRETVHVEDGSKVSVLISPYFEDLLCTEGAELSADATFDARPSHPATQQFLSIHVAEETGGEIYNFPCAYVLMERKSEAAYIAALRCINSAVGGSMKPRTVMADYEKSVHNAFKFVFPNIETSGCWFHYTNAVHKQSVECGLEELCVANELADKAVQKCMALPLLPPTAIEEGLCLIEEDLRIQNLKQPFSKFIGYIKSQWINDAKVGVDTLSVFELDSRTNNALENSHLQLIKKLQVCRPNFWVFYSMYTSF